jgi:uncharacterized protein (DUF2252 family)
MQEFASMSILAVWYARMDVEDTIARFKSKIPKEAVRQSANRIAKIRTRESTQAVAKLTTVVDGQRQIIADPPLIVPIEALANEGDVAATYDVIRSLLRDYARTLSADRQHLLDHFTLTRVARKVVGVGSVGTQAWIVVMEADGGLTPLILQAKQAQRSVLTDCTAASRDDNQGERVVAGQRLIQAASDIFLGWQRTTLADGSHTDYCIRQLRDWKYSAPVEQLTPSTMAVYGGLCGWTLARAHARTGDRGAIAAYLGTSDRFDRAVADFGEVYADQNERDRAALVDAVKSGRAQAQQGI